MRQQEGFLRILWRNVKGELGRAVRAGEFEGAISFAVSHVARTLVLTALGPYGPALLPLGSVLFRSGLRLFREAYGEWQRGVYSVRTTKSGLTVLERPRLAVAHVIPSDLPQRLEIPTQSIVQPAPSLLFNPAFAARAPFLASSAQPLSALLSRRFGSPAGRLLQATRASDVVYPGWLLGGQRAAGQRTARPAGSAALAQTGRGPDLFEHQFNSFGICAKCGRSRIAATAYGRVCLPSTSAASASVRQPLRQPGAGHQFNALGICARCGRSRTAVEAYGRSCV